MDRQGFGGKLTDQQWVRLLKEGSTREFRSGRAVMRQGEHGRTIFLLVEGMVKVEMTLPDGAESLLAIRGPGSLLGEGAALSGLPRAATVTATGGTCRTRAMSGARFRTMLTTLDLEQVLWEDMVLRQHESDSLRAEMASLPARQRLAATLLRLAQLVGDSSCAVSGFGAVTIRLGLSQRELGDWIGLSRAAVAAEYTRLRSRGIIRTGRELVTIHDVEGLRAVAEGAR